MTVLNTEQVSVLGGNGWAVTAFIVVILLALISAAVMMSTLEMGYGRAFLVMIAITGGLIFLAIKLHAPATVTYEQYEVIIEDYNEMYEQGYEIVEQRGEISVVKKKEGE